MLKSPFSCRSPEDFRILMLYPNVHMSSFMPQSIASDLTLLSMIKIRKEMPYVQVRLPVHDSILVECDPDWAEEVAVQMKAIMEDTAAKEFDTFVPFPADTEIQPPHELEVSAGADWVS